MIQARDRGTADHEVPLPNSRLPWQLNRTEFWPPKMIEATPLVGILGEGSRKSFGVPLGTEFDVFTEVSPRSVDDRQRECRRILRGLLSNDISEPDPALDGLLSIEMDGHSPPLESGFAAYPGSYLIRQLPE